MLKVGPTMELPTSSASMFVLFWISLSSYFMQTTNGLNSCPNLCTCTRGTVSTGTLEVSCVDRNLAELPHHLPYASSYRLLLAHNAITVLDSRPYLDRTVYLDLSHNNVHNLTNKAMKELVGNVRYLHLDHNKLTCLPLAMKTTEVVASVNEITLHNNPWNCSCLEIILHKWIKDDHRQVVDTNSLQCQDQPDSSMRNAHKDAIHNKNTEKTSEEQENKIVGPKEGNTNKWCDLPKVKDSKLTQRQGFLAFITTIISIGMIFAGLGLLYFYKYMLKQKERERHLREETDDTKAMITHI